MPGIAALHLRITELLVHGWDLATGQPTAVPTADLAAIELEFSRGPSGPALPPGHSPFAPPQPAPDGAPGIVNDQLAALLGRPLRNPV